MKGSLLSCISFEYLEALDVISWDLLWKVSDSSASNSNLFFVKSKFRKDNSSSVDENNFLQFFFRKILLIKFSVRKIENKKESTSGSDLKFFEIKFCSWNFYSMSFLGSFLGPFNVEWIWEENPWLKEKFNFNKSIIKLRNIFKLLSNPLFCLKSIKKKKRCYQKSNQNNQQERVIMNISSEQTGRLEIEIICKYWESRCP